MKRFSILAVGLGLFVSGQAFAASETVSEIGGGFGAFGTVGQGAPGVVNPNVACGPTSVYNSFVFLQNTYGITGLLQPGAASNTINQLGAWMNGSAPSPTNTGVGSGGVSAAGLVQGKIDYINQQPGLSDKIKVESKFADAGNGADMAKFIYDQLKAGQDVEIGFTWNGGTGGHVVTLTGMTYDPTKTTDGDTVGSLNFLDPWGSEGSTPGSSAATITGDSLTDPQDELTLDAAGNLVLSYTGGGAGELDEGDGGGANDFDGGSFAGSGTIAVVAAESPVPLPSTVFAGFSLLGALFFFSRRSRITNTRLSF